MAERIRFSCANCAVTACDGKKADYPEFCLTKNLDKEELEKALACYEGSNREVMIAAAEVEYEGYLKRTRVEETIEFAKKLSAKKIGIATCVGLIGETRTLAKILRSNGFSVYGIACKAGATEKTKVGIPECCSEIGENMCNPILQARLLNKEQTDLNIVMGLCVGHDSLFYKYSEAITTTLVAKDRVTGHNPAAALYMAQSYYKRLFSDEND